MTYIKRKNIICSGKYVILASLLFFTAFYLRAQSSDTVKFIHISDPHICFLDGLHPAIQGKRSHYGGGVAALEGFLDTFSKNPTVDFITITGDLIDFYQGVSPDSRLVENQIKQFSPILQKSRVPVYMNLGNHDIATYLVESGDYKGIQYYAQSARAVWIKSVTCFKQGTYYSKIQQVGSTTYRLIFLDNGYYAKNRINDEDFYFDNEQLDWLEWQLNQSQDDEEIIFMHIPFMPNQDRWGGSQHLFDLLMRHNSVKLILAGHEHFNEVNSFQSDHKGQFIQVLTGAFGRDTNNWRMIELTESEIKVSTAGSGANEITILN